MNYQEFLTTIRTQLSLRIETGVTLDIRSFTKITEHITMVWYFSIRRKTCHLRSI